MSVFIAAHALGASLALTLGGYNLIRKPKGDRAHRIVGGVWVLAMYWTVLSSFWIKRLDPGHFSWIHLLSIFTFLTLSVGLWSAMTGRVEQHRANMMGSYFGLVGAFIGAVAVPTRDVPQLAVNRPLVLLAAIAAVLVATGLVIVAAGLAGRARSSGAASLALACDEPEPAQPARST